MKKCISIIFLLLFFLIIYNTPTTIIICINILNTFFSALFPSLFLILVCSKFLYYYGIFNQIYNILPSNLKYYYYPFLACLLGFSGNAAFLNNHQELSQINQSYILKAFNIPTFSFVVFSLGYYLNNYLYSSVLLLIQMIACLILFRFTPFTYPAKVAIKTIPFSDCLKKALVESGINLYMMLAYIIIISSIASIFSTNLIFLSIMEFSTSTINITTLNIPIHLKLLALSIVLGFGSISSHIQVFNLTNIKMKYSTFLCFRILQALLAFLLTITYLYICF